MKTIVFLIITIVLLFAALTFLIEVSRETKDDEFEKDEE